MSDRHLRKPVTEVEPYTTIQCNAHRPSVDRCISQIRDTLIVCLFLSLK